MSWATVIGVGGSLIGGLMSKKGADDQQADIKQMRDEDWERNKQNYATQLRDSRVNRSSPFQTSKWTQDADGKWSQENAFTAPEQALYDQQNAIKQARNASAAGIKLPSRGIDWDSLGFGALAKGAGVGEGTTGKRPWADQPYTSGGGNFLNFMSQAPSSYGTNRMPITPFDPRYPGPAQQQPNGGQATVDVADLLKQGG